jgi:hypothetical protein
MITNNPITISDTSDQFLDTALRLKLTNPVGMYMYMDMPPKAGEKETLSMKLFSKSLATQSRSVKAIYRNETTEHLKTNFDIDPKLEIVNQLVREDLDVLQLKLYNLYCELGKENTGKRTRWQTFAEKKLKVSMPIYTSSVIKSILMLSNYIMKTSRRGKIDFIVVARNLGALIQDSPEFVFLPVTRNFKTIELIGSVHGISVFVNHSLPMNNFTVTAGRKTNPQESGVVIGEYSKTVYDVVNPDFSTNCVIGSEDVISSAGFHPSINYYSREIRIDKAPLWKRILQLVPTI